MSSLTHIDISRNRRRFYTIQVARNLFGEWSLFREWGRIGSPGRLRCETFDSESQAREAQHRTVRLRERHGYKPARE